jgi:hypothetical protein
MGQGQDRSLSRGAASVRAERDARVWTLSIEGWSQWEIAQEVGITQARVSQIINRVADSIKRPAAEAIIQQENSKLDAAERAVMGVLKAKHVLVRGDGVVRQLIVDIDTGLPLRDPVTNELLERDMEDDAPVLAAVDRLMKIYERRAKLNGLDAPTKIEQTTYAYSVNGVEMTEADKLG